MTLAIKNFRTFLVAIPLVICSGCLINVPSVRYGAPIHGSHPAACDGPEMVAEAPYTSDFLAGEECGPAVGRGGEIPWPKYHPVPTKPAFSPSFPPGPELQTPPPPMILQSRGQGIRR